MDTLTLYGFCSVLLMLIAYTLESKARYWTLLFALGCFSSALYGYLASAAPFAVLESIWGVIALVKWRGRAKGLSESDKEDFALGQLIDEADRTKIVSREQVMKRVGRA